MVFMKPREKLIIVDSSGQVCPSYSLLEDIEGVGIGEEIAHAMARPLNEHYALIIRNKVKVKPGYIAYECTRYSGYEGGIFAIVHQREEAIDGLRSQLKNFARGYISYLRRKHEEEGKELRELSKVANEKFEDMVIKDLTESIV